MLAHGYRDKAADRGVDETAALDAGFAGIDTGLNAQRYATAASSYKDNGWAVKEPIRDVTTLESFFGESVATPESTLLVGFSLASFRTYELAERTCGLFDGFRPALRGRRRRVARLLHDPRDAPRQGHASLDLVPARPVLVEEA